MILEPWKIILLNISLADQVGFIFEISLKLEYGKLSCAGFLIWQQSKSVTS